MTRTTRTSPSAEPTLDAPTEPQSGDVAAVLIALTFGQLGDSKDGMPNFFTQLGQVRNKHSC